MNCTKQPYSTIKGLVNPTTSYRPVQSPARPFVLSLLYTASPKPHINA